MKTIHLLFCLAGLIIISIACTVNDQQMTVDDKVRIEKEVTEVFEKMMDVILTLNYNDLEPFNNFNEEYSMVMDGTIYLGGEKGKELFKTSFEYVEKYLYVNLLDQKAIALDRNTALYLLTFDESYVMTTGDTLKVNGSGSYIFELINEDWKVVHISAVHNMVE